MSASTGGMQIDTVSVVRGGRPVVRGVSIDVPPGQVTTLLGPNGAGKSSLALAIAGLLRTAGGHVRIGGSEITNRKPESVRAAGVSVVPEGRRLLSDLTVRENLEVATFSLEKSAAAQGMAYVRELFPELEKRWDISSRLLSGGEQQMVVLGQALVARPKILVIDELSLGLAPIVVSRLVPTLASVAASGTGILLIEQFAHVALSVATDAHVLEGGLIRYSGKAVELREHPELLHSAYLLRDGSGAH